MHQKLTKIITVLAFVVSFAVVQAPQALAYDTYWNGDRNYVLVYGHQGVSWYLDKSSAVKKRDDREAVAFACNVISVVDGEANGTKTYWYYFSRQSGDDMTAYHSNDGNTWNPFKINDISGATGVVTNTFKAGWKAALGYPWS